jgi:hypothetical protein
LLIQKYKVCIDEKPELLFYSCYSNNYLNYNCTRIFYAGENVRPDFFACDFAFSFDYNHRKNHFRLPLYSLYIDHHNMLGQLQTIRTRDEAREIWRSKTKFCCMVVSNPNSSKRLEFYNTLSQLRQVDSGGSVLNNVGGRVANKTEFIKDYKFVISFENSEQDGYTTEKIMEPILVDCIPIYWGNKLIDKDFNAKRFLDYNKFESEKKLIDKLLEIDQNDELAIDMLLQPTFSENKLSHKEEHLKVLNILSLIIDNPDKSISRQFWRSLHKFKLLCYKFKRDLKKFKLV